jgi:hypothetical protein
MTMCSPARAVVVRQHHPLIILASKRAHAKMLDATVPDPEFAISAAVGQTSAHAHGTRRPGDKPGLLVLVTSVADF